MKTDLRFTKIIVVTLASLFLVANVTAEVRTYESDDVPKLIPDPGTISSSLTVPDSMIITDVDVVLKIMHNFDDDLDVYLIHDGVTVELFTDVGGVGNDFWNTELDDECATPIIEGNPPFTGCYKPEGNLSDFDGLNAQGTWQLKVKDDDEVMRGLLQSWSLSIEFTPPAVYLWNGTAGDGLWETPANWTVTDSIWTWPNEENAADPNLAKNINSDTGGIDILNGDAVSRGSDLGIDGAADGSTTGVLTLNNASSLTVSGSLATGTDPVKRGQIDILGGSFVTIVGDGNDLIIADEPDSWGALNIVDSTVDIADDLKAGDGGEGHVTIGGSTTVNCDDLYIADAATGVGYLDISGTTTVTIVDDFTIDEGTGIATIGGDAVINFGDDLYVADKGGSVGTLILTGNSIFNVGDDMNIGDDDGSEGHMIVTGNATLNAPDELYISDSAGAVGSLDVSGTAMVTISDDLNVGDDGPGSCNIGENATVNVADKIYVAGELGSEGSLNISGNATVETGGDFVVADVAGNTGYLHISGNPTIHTVGNFYMNDDEGAPSTSEVIMDGGTVTVDGTSTFNDDNPGTATFIMNGGSWYSKDYLNVSDNLDGTAHLTMNGGEMITGAALRLGKDGGDDIGQVRIFMNGGLLQAEELDIKITDTKIIYIGGQFRINKAKLDEAGMQQLITDGTIVAEGAYSIVTDGDYTVLNPAAPPMP